MHSKKKLIILTFLLSFLATGTVWANYRLVIQAGHDAAPTAMEWHEKSRTIVSTGNDGRLIVTRPSDSKVLHRFRITEYSIVSMKTNPDENRAALVIQKPEGFVVQVWDWDDEKKLFDYTMESEPLFVSWSAHGRYLSIGQLSSPSVLMLEGRTGRKLSYLRRLPAIYNDAYIGSTESILMTYSSSGSIRYWDIRSSALKLSAETTNNLRGLTVLQTGSKSTLFAYRNQTLFLVNRQTGAILDQIDVRGLIDVSVDPENGELDALSSSASGSAIHEYEVSTDRFLPRGFVDGTLSRTAIPKPLDRSLQALRVLRSGGKTFLIDGNGSILAREPDSAADFGFSPIIDDKLWRPDSLAFQGSGLLMSGGQRLMRFNADFFAEDAKGSVNELEKLTKEDFYVDTDAEKTGLIILDNESLIVWDKSATSRLNGYSVVDIQSDIQSPDSQRRILLAGTIQKMEELTGRKLLTVDRNGTVALLDPSDGQTLSAYSALGVLDAAYSDDGNYILTGRSSAGQAGTPLEQVDLETRESVPVPDKRFMVYAITQAPEHLFSIGVARSSNGKMNTLLVQHEKGDPSQSRVILDVDGEDLDAVMLPHPEGKGIYTSLGGKVQRIFGNRKIQFPSEEPVVGLFLRASVLYGIDADGAVVLWNADSGRLILRVHLFNDGGWIAIPPDGEVIWASQGAISNVVLYRNGRPIDPRRVSRTVNDAIGTGTERIN